MTAKDEYDIITAIFLLKRASETITDNEEEEILDQMDDLWWEMTEEERKEMGKKWPDILERAGLKDIV